MPVLYKHLGGELCDFPKPELKREIAALLIRLFAYFNSKPNDVQIEDTVTDIITTYPDMGLAELKIGFQRVRVGYYGKEAGKAFGAVNPQNVMDVIKLMYIEGQEYRCDLREMRNDEYKRKELEQSPLSFVDADKVREYREAMEKKIDDAEKEKREAESIKRQSFQERKEELLKKYYDNVEILGEPKENQSA